MADIFEEVEEGLRQDRATNLWKKYGIFAYIAAGLLIGGVALNEYMQYRTAQSVEQNALQFELASEQLDAQNYEAAASDFSTIAGGDARIAPVAAGFVAEARLQGNADTAAAISALEAAANTDTPIGKLTLIKAAYLKSASMTLAETEAYLGGLMGEESQFGALALELVAAKAVAEQDYDYARQALYDLRFLANVPPGVQQRATSALSTLPPDEAVAPQDDGQQDTTGGKDSVPATDGDQPE